MGKKCRYPGQAFSLLTAYFRLIDLASSSEKRREKAEANPSPDGTALTHHPTEDPETSKPEVAPNDS